MEPTRFAVNIPAPELDDLRRRLDHARLAPDYANDDWSYGVEGAYLADLVRYWREEYDWRAEQARINELAHFRVELDGVPLHFVHERGHGPRPLPLVLSHGWPLTFWDFHAVIGPLTRPADFGGDPADAFDVVVPSLPGFAFSSPSTFAGMNFWTAAELWLRLMRDVLGYERFGAHGGDFGARLSAQLGHTHAQHIIGLHLTQPVGPLSQWSAARPWADMFGPVIERAAPDERADIIVWEREHASHLAINALDPQTIAYALNDSPVGLAAWLVQRRRNWSDCGGDVERRFSRDDLLTTVMLYWLTQTAGSAARSVRGRDAQPVEAGARPDSDGRGADRRIALPGERSSPLSTRLGRDPRVPTTSCSVGSTSREGTFPRSRNPTRSWPTFGTCSVPCVDSCGSAVHAVAQGGGP